MIKIRNTFCGSALSDLEVFEIIVTTSSYSSNFEFKMITVQLGTKINWIATNSVNCNVRWPSLESNGVPSTSDLIVPNTHWIKNQQMISETKNPSRERANLFRISCVLRFKLIKYRNPQTLRLFGTFWLFLGSIQISPSPLSEFYQELDFNSKVSDFVSANSQLFPLFTA